MPDSPDTLRPAEPCLNCDTPVEQDFCPSCGQRRGDYRKSLWRLVGEVFRETLELDGRLGRTLRAMLRPGRLTREFNRGRRARFVSPVRLYLFISLLMFATAGISLRLHAMDDPPDEGVTRFDTEKDPEIGSTALGRLLEERIAELEKLPAAERDKQVFAGTLDHGPLLMFVMLPVFALILELVFLGTGRLYVEHLVFSLHVHTVWFLLVIPALAIPFSWSPLFLLGIPIYTIAALQHAYDASWWATLLRSVAVGFMYFVALVLGLASAFLLALLLG